MSNSVLSLTGVRKVFNQGGRKLEVLRGADLTIQRGEMVALVGPSGAGKSTLLQICGLLEGADGGEISIDGNLSSGLGERQRTALRGRTIGFVYQYHHLLPEFSALENIVIPQLIADRPRGVARQRAEALLRQVGLEDRAGHRPGQLSGGEQQRVAMARALANGPALLLADEPTGNLDPGTGDRVFEVLTTLVREEGLAALIATHNYDLAARMDRTLSLQDGRILEG
ncbi:ABC transporter ATP-binding protein [Limibacillus halophilus]|uniref:Lipoprotein-releasing system ATP-binding protein n=1 Tax=Limibacillus halophilus TaxID=1579333 RepID=A0A839SY39_9PROT|nr:ABC transporter ATP-binding protein [Limibacillus halophilus]MBB3065873.1 lipoprotein-releasing system ATP-binding protein [Limibacillus halophilus]